MFKPVLVLTDNGEVHVFLDPDEALGYTAWLNHMKAEYTVLQYPDTFDTDDSYGDRVTLHRFEHGALADRLDRPAFIIHEPIA